MKKIIIEIFRRDFSHEIEELKRTLEKEKSLHQKEIEMLKQVNISGKKILIIFLRIWKIKKIKKI